MLFTKAAATGLALLAGLVSAHPGHDVAQEAAERREFLAKAKRTDLSHCAEKLRARGIEAKNIARRKAQVEAARWKRNIKKRDIGDVLAKSHNKTSLGYTPNTEAGTLFAGINSCILSPEVTQGPYYVAGEYVRENLIEDQEGIELLVDYQVIDVETCDPVPNVYLEAWACNATGVYGGVIAGGNGNTADASNINNTWLRGIQPTDEDGVARFQTIFPGHYTGRTAHIHIMVHTNATLQANQTLGHDNYASHIGQAYFDQDLITAVEKTAPYNTNRQPLTTNAQDFLLAQGSAGAVDPVMEYTLLGDSIEDGLFAWLSFGIDTSVSNKINPAVWLGSTGGVSNPNPGFGGPGGPPPPGFTPPAGWPLEVEEEVEA
ncbi:Intradiol ring-cleavage dioxygenase [Apiosordaria backusii]|uniref:Intradiol ring-cleavage dioxygenase n=1 Tax=Apiosordaria backusii TaxID=314023 RepID=A0AA40B338_9PEZI|nr:Intradiol ring-cleavage dioxygenase [Apiosordaria backusii]